MFLGWVVYIVRVYIQCWGVIVEYRVSYDPVADALYIRTRDDKVADSLEVDDGVVVDFNERGEVVGVEILSFSKSSIDLDRVIKEGLETLIPAR